MSKPKPTSYQPITQEEIDQMLPVVLSDMKHRRRKARQALTTANVRQSLYAYVIREAFGEARFLHKEEETDGSRRVGLFIKGYVRDVWAYLEEAYQLIHTQTYRAQIKAFKAQGHE